MASALGAWTLKQPQDRLRPACSSQPATPRRPGSAAAGLMPRREHACPVIGAQDPSHRGMLPVQERSGRSAVAGQQALKLPAASPVEYLRQVVEPASQVVGGGEDMHGLPEELLSP